MRLPVSFEETNSEFVFRFNPQDSELNANFAEAQFVPIGEIPIATDTILGGIKVGENLKITADGVLSVDVATAVEQDNTKPITSAAVHTEVGNIEVLLAAL